MAESQIVVRGAREHNLRGVNLDLPRHRLIVFTGVSGSGKSSLAFDTLYAEGQRRYVESLSSYARQFLGQLPKPEVEYLGGLSPSVSIQQKTAARNPRSTVGTMTEIHDFLRVLYARVGQGSCPDCGRPITAQSRDQMIARILALPADARFQVLAPLVRGQKGEFKDLFADMLRRGFVRARVDGAVVRLSDDLKLDKRIKHDIAVVVDRLQNDSRVRPRLADAVEQALALGSGTLMIAVEGVDDDLLLSAHYACLRCRKSYVEPTPQMFSFNSPQGMCLACDGLGTRYSFDPDLLIPDPTLSFYDGCISLIGPMKGMGRWRKHIYSGVAATLGIDLRTPWRDLPEQHRDWLLHGSGDRTITYEWRNRGGTVWKHSGKWDGVVPQLLSSFKKTAAGPWRIMLEKAMRSLPCDVCGGARLNPQARAVRIAGRSIVEVAAMSVGDFSAWVAPDGPLERALDPIQRRIAAELLKEIRTRAGFLLDVGLHYLTLDRSAPSLSGGEAQRIRLAGQIGSGLVGVLYILDEPSIGLHPADNDRLLQSLKRLRDLGNTVLVVEHDEETIRAADYVVDFGPGPGIRGGEVVAAGSLEDVIAAPNSLTGQYLSGKKCIALPARRRTISERRLTIVGARRHNLKYITVEIPLGAFVAVTGVSGSGKSTLVNDILLSALASGTPAQEDANGEPTDDEPLASAGRDFDRIDGADQIDKVIAIDQSPIGRTPRSNPATYIKVFDEIRAVFAQVHDAKVRGYSASRFSFNRPGGRCEACEGNGSTRLEMDFLADVWVTCPVCEGRRFNRETLQVRYRGKSIHDVLEMDVQEALAHFDNQPRIRAMLQTLHDVGLDYMKLGQPSPTLSGGEAQRIKLARELCRRAAERTLYVLDEPTTGLHFDDIQKLLSVLHGFVDAGHTVLVIEHNLDVVKTADWVIDLGPHGGEEGGRVVATGPPEQIASVNSSLTGRALRPVLAPTTIQRSDRNRTEARPAPPAAPLTHITVTGAEQHNLKHVSASLPRDALSVFCGPSGSGKSSLALDTIYAEGQRRYVESLSSYARQFLGQIAKPRVERVEGLSPAISIEQKTTSKSPRSTVGTVTEIYDYLRILYARLGTVHCPACGCAVGTQTADEIIARILSMPEGTKTYVMAPIERRGQEKYQAVWDEARRAGFTRIRVDGRSYSLDDPPAIDHRRKHDVEVIVDRLVVRSQQRSRIADAVEQALELGRGVVRIALVDPERDEADWVVQRFSQHMTCESCGRSFEPLNPHHFSFNSPLGWCPTCEGLGVQHGANPTLLIRDPTLSLRDGAIAVWPKLTPGQPFSRVAEAIARFGRFSLDTPFAELEPRQQRLILHGTGDAWLPLERGTRPSSAVSIQYKGLFGAIDEASRISFAYRQKLDHVVGEVPCLACGGSRLRDDAAAVRFGGKTLGELCALPVAESLRFFERLKLSAGERRVAGELFREITSRLRFLVEVGLEYLTLARPAPTLSGGEAQRIRLASQIGSGLTGVLYVLDEPTIGLHPRDNARLLGALRRLRRLGNTLIVVEHDREVIADADYLLDFGPGAGDRGGEITAAGPPAAIAKISHSLTGQYLCGARAIPVPTNRRTGDAGELLIVGARQHNLKNLDVRIPLSRLVAITGVSGSGKSSLVHEVLYNTLARRLHRARTEGAAHDEIRGVEAIDKIINVDQEPIDNTPSSNPATYSGVFDLIRQLFAQLPESKVRGYQPRRFSFNKPGGRCEACEGNGQKRIELHFLPDVWVECDVCGGRRYSPETLAVQYKGRSIADVLNLRIGEALELFGNIPRIRSILQTLADVGLDYLRLGQPAPTLSGGEAQRVKLAAELARPQTGRTLYLLDEPTTGLHFEDVRRLLDVLHRLVDFGNTVIVVEHNLDVIKSADWVIDLGPEAGDAGGKIVAAGPPEIIAKSAASHTGAALKKVLEAGPRAPRPRFDVQAAAAERDGDLELAAVGRDIPLPWEVDGRRWHTQERRTATGKPARWDGTILTWLDQQIHRLGSFGSTNWNHRSIVEIPAEHKSQGWFLHAMTGREWLVRLVFRVGRNTFRQTELSARLALPSAHTIEGMDVFGETERVQVANRRGPWQEVAVLAHKLSDIDTPAFRAFLAEAVEAFAANLGRMRTRPEDVMPWKLHGEKWHLSEKGFPPGQRVRWDRTILPRLLAEVRQIEPALEVKWDTRDAITLRVPGISRAWAQWRTKSVEALDCRFLSGAGSFNLARVEGLGGTAEMLPHRDGEVLHVAVKQITPAQYQEWRRVLADHLAEFRAAFRGNGEA